MRTSAIWQESTWGQLVGSVCSFVWFEGATALFFGALVLFTGATARHDFVGRVAGDTGIQRSR